MAEEIMGWVIMYICLLILASFLIGLLNIALFGDNILVFLDKKHRKELEYRMKTHKGLQHEAIRLLKVSDIELYLWIKKLMKIDAYRLLFYYLSNLGVLDKYLIERMDRRKFSNYISSGSSKKQCLEHSFKVEISHFNRVLHLPYSYEAPIKGLTWKFIESNWVNFLHRAYTTEEQNEFNAQIYNFVHYNLGI